MKWITRSSQQKLKMPTTHIYHMLDNQLSVVVRAWGSLEYNQKLIDEISYYLSSAQADLDVTSPFEFKENLSSLANKTRIALLLAHDFFYKSENKTEFKVGFEVLIFFKIKNELAWSSVGRFSLAKFNTNYFQTFFNTGSSYDDETLLPAELLGVESHVEINSGSILIKPQNKLIITSTYGGELKFEIQDDHFLISPSVSDMTYWYSLINED